MEFFPKYWAVFFTGGILRVSGEITGIDHGRLMDKRRQNHIRNLRIIQQKQSFFVFCSIGSGFPVCQHLDRFCGGGLLPYSGEKDDGQQDRHGDITGNFQLAEDRHFLRSILTHLQLPDYISEPVEEHSKTDQQKRIVDNGYGPAGSCGVHGIEQRTGHGAEQSVGISGKKEGMGEKPSVFLL